MSTQKKLRNEIANLRNHNENLKRRLRAYHKSSVAQHNGIQHWKNVSMNLNDFIIKAVLNGKTN